MSLLTVDSSSPYRVSDHCPHHGRDSSFDWFFRVKLAPTWQSDTPGLARMTHDRYLELRGYRCLYRDGIVLVLFDFADSESELDFTAIESGILYPNVDAPKMSTDAPPEVASLWEEAAVCANAGGLRGAAGCLRAAIEQIVKERGATGKDLKAKIDDLGQKTGLDSEIVTALHDTRLTGNWSLHDGVSFSREEIDDLSQLVKDTVEILDVQPARRAAMATARAARRGGRTA